ncbi:MAG TPA: cytochrome c oxidase accessory protein CcoG [Myxococcota bacterium]|nr:cytochrome c oxidase accessory protein CcoG [Myxococcota bacterium]
MLSARPVRGRFRRLRTIAYALLIVFLFALPWIRVDGLPLVLLDVPARQFHVFGLVIFPQELYFLWLIVVGAALALFFVTALLGRLWCGWACPQTVFTDLYAGIARRIQGWKGRARPARVAAWRIALTHAVWLALSALVALHLVGYFRSPYEILAGLRSGVVYPTSLAFLGAITLLTYLDFGVVRQVFCKFLCPYARFQSVLFDRDTLVVAYDAARGEPRGKAGRVAGDCVDCRLCVAVCPTGIDIRQGLQLECIACTQCIDACDGVMHKLSRRPSLIGYRSLAGLEGRPARLLRPRTAVYAALLALVFAAFGTLLARRLPMDLSVAHSGTSLVAHSADGRIGNAFTVRITNRGSAAQRFRLALDDEDDYELVAGMNPIPVGAASSLETRVFVLTEEDLPADGHEIRFVLEPESGGMRVVRSARFVATGGSHGS